MNISKYKSNRRETVYKFKCPVLFPKHNRIMFSEFSFLIRGIRRSGISSFGELFGGLIIRGDGFGGMIGNRCNYL